MPLLLKQRFSRLFSPELALPALLLLLVLWPTRGAAEEPVGVVVALPGVALPPLVKKAEAIGGARWSGRRVATPAGSDHLRTVIDQGRRAYLEADFMLCLSICRTALAETSLESRTRHEVGKLVFLSAACAHGAGDRALATAHLQRLFVQELAKKPAFMRTRPDFQELLEAVRQQQRSLAPVRVQVSSTPQAARLLVDGRLFCHQTPCAVRLPPGEHLFALRRLGVGQRTERRMVSRDATLMITLDRLGPAEAAQELSSAVKEAGSISYAQAAATAFSGQIVAVVWSEEAGQAHAMLYDHRGGKTISRAKVRGKAAAISALQAALLEWRSQAKPFYAKPAFYVPVAVAAALGAAAVVVYLAARPRETRTEFVFP